MLLAEARGVGEPGKDVAQRADGKMHQYRAAAAVVIMGEDGFAVFPYFDAEADEEAF